MDYVEGIIKSTLFYNEENSYSVLKLEITDTTEKNLLYSEPTLIICGFFPKLENNVRYRFYGELKSHPKYGLQYNAQKYERQMENSRDGIIDYLSSDLFKGIGPKTAERIVDKLGTDCLEKIINDPFLLDRVPRLAADKKKMIHEQLLKNRQAESTLVWLYGFQISPKMAMKIYGKYGFATIDQLKQNPYLLMDTVEGIGFKRADEIGLKIGFAYNDPHRIRAVVMYLLGEYVSKFGDTLLEKAKLMQYSEQYLRVSEETFVEVESIESIIQELISEGKIIEHKDSVSLTYLFQAEQTVARLLKGFTEPITDLIDEVLLDQYLTEFEMMNGITYTDNQKDAIKTALAHPLSIITGGPGTGKTTIIKGIVRLYMQMHQGAKDAAMGIRLAAPTGKAAKRLSESTGLEATTIHRLLGYDFEGHFTYDEHNLLLAKLVIIDEASMMDILLAKQLFQALKPHTKIVIVGDENQLPSVGPGQVLTDLLASELFPIVRLTKIHRQAADSSIIRLAYDILNQNLNDNVFDKYPDRSFIRANEMMIPEVIVKVITEAIAAGYDLREDIQVLIPMYKGVAGIDAINHLLQSTFNKENAENKIGGGDKVFLLNDKVLQLANQPEDGIMNGDLGIVSDILNNRDMIVNFSGNCVKYNIKDFDSLTLAYAASVHKAQGSEYKVVILPLVRSQSIMLKRKLLYTAVTRAKEKLVMIGDYGVMKHGILGIENPRKTLLREFLLNDDTDSKFDFLTIEDFM